MMVVVSKEAADAILKYGEKVSYNDVFTGWMNMHYRRRWKF